MMDKKKELREEIERLEKEYEHIQAKPVPDKKKTDHLYKRLKKARKELKELDEKKK
jgi:peptidoglycan hydrolase CwlO-like protein